MLGKISIFSYASTLDLVMGFYNICLSDAANKVCTITTPFRKYEYNHTLMGAYIAPDIFQEKMGALMEDLEFVRFYIGD